MIGRSNVKAMRTVPGPTDSVVVVGAGLGGLSAALHLAGAGRHVTVVEREAVPGGRAGLLRDHGYHFDTGPTVLTMPELLAQALAAVGETARALAHAAPPRPGLPCPVRDGTSIDVRADVTEMADEIARTCGASDAAGYREFVSYLRRLYALEMPHFIDRNLDSPTQLVGLPLARLVLAGRLPQARREGRAASSVTTGCSGCSPSRPCTPVSPRPRRSRSIR